MEQTLVLIKPEGIRFALINDVIRYIEQGPVLLYIDKIKTVNVTKELAEEHYKEHKDKPHFDKLVMHLMGKFHDTNRVIAIIVSGLNAINDVRFIVGDTNPEEADLNTIRGEFGQIREIDGYEVWENIVHASSSKEEAEREIKLWFGV